MQTNLLWTGREYYSLEYCLVHVTDQGAEVTSTIIGKYKDILYRVEYEIKTNRQWETVWCSLQSQHSDQIDRLLLEKDASGNWLKNGLPADEFKDCTDVDIPLTPFTNTLPIKRLRLTTGSERIIHVIYIDLLERQIQPVQQKYKRMSNLEYHYENVPNDFEADILVDEQGFVVDYPRLFTRTATLKANYRPPSPVIAEQLISRLQESFNGRPWYGESLMSKLNSLDFKKVNQQLLPSKNSISRLVQHIINWRIFVIKKLEGDKEFDIRLNDSNDWSDIEISNRRDWEQLLEKLGNTQQRITELLSEKEDAFMALQVPGKSYNYRYLVEGLVQHDIYHLGQIALIQKITE